MALWMTVEQVCIGLAAMLLVLTCVCLHGGFRAGGIGGNERRLPVFFGYLTAIWLGLMIGAIRMEYEEWILHSEKEMILEKNGSEVQMTGQVAEIKTADHGLRLMMTGCRWTEEASDKRIIRKMYVYTEMIETLNLGMYLTIHGTCELPEPDRNPGEFDYRQYCHAKGVAGIFYTDHVFQTQTDDEATKYINSVYFQKIENDEEQEC